MKIILIISCLKYHHSPKNKSFLSLPPLCHSTKSAFRWSSEFCFEVGIYLHLFPGTEIITLMVMPDYKYWNKGLERHAQVVFSDRFQRASHLGFKSPFTQQLGLITVLILKSSSGLPPASWDFSLTCHIVSYLWVTVDIVFNPYKYYSWLSLNGHLYKTDTLVKWIPRGQVPAFLYSLNLTQDRHLFKTDT